MTTKDWNKIKNNFDSEIYRYVRVVKIQEGKPDEIVIPFNKVSSNKKNSLERFNYVRMKCEDLPPGQYQVQCRLAQGNHGIQDNYNLEVKEKKTLVFNSNGRIEDKTKEQQHDMVNDEYLEKYMESVKANSELSAMNQILEYERDMYKKLYNELLAKGTPGLSDSGEDKKSNGDKWMESIKEVLTGMFPLAEKLVEQRDKSLDIQLKKFDLMNDRNKKPAVKKITKRTRDLQGEAELLSDELCDVYEQDGEDEYNSRLDDLEEKDPALYELVIAILEPEEEGEETDEDSEEGEEDAE